MPSSRRGAAARRVAIVMNLEYALKRHQAIFAGAYRYARQRGWQVEALPFSEQLRSAGREEAAYDGIIARVDRRLAGVARAAGVPLVNVWYSSPVTGLPLVCIDPGKTSGLAADHLRSLGFRRFAFAGFDRVRVSADLEKGFREALGDVPVSYDRFSTALGFSSAAGLFGRFERSFRGWLGGLRRPVGLYVADDGLARHIVNVALACGIDVPGELGIVGSFNDEPFCLLSEPTLTSIDYGYDRVGYRAAKLLDELMDGKPAPAQPIMLSPKELIPRDSTDVFACEDPLVARALRFMADNCHKPINVTDVVAKLGICGRTLARRFRKARACRPIDELTRMRITRAKRLLQEGDLSHKKVAAQCGFSTSSQFIVAFRRLERMTPGEFRARA